MAGDRTRDAERLIGDIRAALVDLECVLDTPEAAPADDDDHNDIDIDEQGLWLDNLDNPERGEQVHVQWADEAGALRIEVYRVGYQEPTDRIVLPQWMLQRIDRYRGRTDGQ